MSNRLMSAVAVLALSTMACGGGAGTPKSDAAAPAANAPAAAAAPAAGGDSIGVPECDEYIKKYESCVNSKVPESARAQVKATFEAARAAWKQAASTPQGKQGLVIGCKQAND